MSARIDAWMRQAESDFRVGQLTEAQNFHSQACYHYGQTAEKALKGLLISLGIVPPYSHSLDRLVDELAGQGINVAPLRKLHLKGLSRMNSESRYPRDDEAPVDRFDARDSSLACHAAQVVLNFVRLMVG